MPKRIKSHRVKKHRNYTIGEVAELLEIHRNTIRNWINNENLPVIKDKKPWLLVGSILKEFLEKRNAARKRPLGFGEFFCVGCKQPRPPAGEMIEYQTSSSGGILMSALCPVCEKMMKLGVSGACLEAWKTRFDK